MSTDNFEVIKNIFDRPQGGTGLLRQIGRKLRLGETEVEQLLERWVSEGKLFRYPPYRTRKPRYATVPPLVLARELVPELCGKPVTESDLRNRLKKQLGPLDDGQFRGLLEELVEARAIYRHPPVPRRGRTAKYCVSPPPIEIYLRDAMLRLNKAVDMLEAAGVDRQQVLTVVLDKLREDFGLEAAPPETPPTSPVSPDHVLDLIKQSLPEARRGSLIAIRDIRKLLAARGMNCEAADTALLELARRGRIYLHRHDYPSGLPPEKRKDLLADGQGNYYVGMVIAEEVC